jgi:hypothetical protein
MSATALARLAAAVTLASGAVLASFALATPAHAEGEVDVNMSGLNGSITAGGRGDNFTVRLRNETDRELTFVRRVFTVRLDGLTPEGVRMSGRFGELQKQASGNGEVRLVDLIQVSLGPEGRSRDDDNRTYQIAFTDQAPGGRASVVVSAVQGNQLLGSDDDSVNVRGEDRDDRTTEPPTTTEPPLTGSTQPAQTFAPVDGGPVAAVDTSGSGIPIIFYVIGALLVGAGGFILWLLFREPRPALVDAGPVTDTYRPAHLSHPVYPPPAGPRPPTPPTAVMPAVRSPQVDPHVPQHRPVDPWAGQADDQF